MPQDNCGCDEYYSCIQHSDMIVKLPNVDAGIRTLGNPSKGQVFGFEKASFSDGKLEVEVDKDKLLAAVHKAARLKHQEVIEQLRAAYSQPPEQFKGAARGILETADTRLNDLEGEVVVKWKLQS